MEIVRQMKSVSVNSVMKESAPKGKRKAKAALKPMNVLSSSVKVINVSVLKKYRSQKEERK